MSFSRTARALASAIVVTIAMLPLLSSAACSTGNSCLRLSDCADGKTCQAGQCALATPIDSDAGEASVATGDTDANTAAQDSNTVDGGGATDAATGSDAASESDADAEIDGESTTEETDAG